MYSGGVRGGKTFALALKTAMRAGVPKSREIICRKSLVAFKATTLRTLLDGDGATPPILPADSYAHHKSEKRIMLHGGGEIVYFGIDDPASIGSYSGTGAAADEAIELTERDYRMLTSRASVSVPGLRQQVNLACNPGPPSHHLARRFGLAPDTRAAAGTHAILSSTRDNHYLSADYLDYLDTMRGTLWHRRFVLGQWCGNDGTVYDRWDRAVHVRVREGPWARLIVGIDDGYTNPFAALLIGVDGDGRMHVLREVYERQLLMDAKMDHLGSLAAGVETMVYDPSAVDLGAEIRRRDWVGVEADPANNAVADGIAGVQRRLAVQGDGLPRLTVDPSCEHTITEFETYEWDRSVRGDILKDKPRKASDHAMDAARYGLRYIDGNEQPMVTVIDRRSAAVERQTAAANSIKAESAYDLYQRLRSEDEDFGFVANGKRNI
jgi:phage terminase large subunit